MKPTIKEKEAQYVKELKERRELMEQMQQSVVNGDCESVLI